MFDLRGSVCAKCGVRRSRYNILIVDVRFSVFRFSSSAHRQSVLGQQKTRCSRLGEGGGGGRGCCVSFLGFSSCGAQRETLPVDATGRRAAVRKLSFETPAQLAVAGPNRDPDTWARDKRAARHFGVCQKVARSFRRLGRYFGVCQKVARSFRGVRV